MKKAMTVETVLRKGLALLIKEGWIQGDYHREGEGYCAIGACRAIAKNLDMREMAIRALSDAIPGRRSNHDILVYNDDHRRKKSEIIAVFRQAINQAHADRA